MSLVQGALAPVVLLVAAPSLPARWASITHYGQIHDNGGEQGYVTVEHCAPRVAAIGLLGSCTGFFQVNDRMAELYQPTPAVRVANDFDGSARRVYRGNDLGGLPCRLPLGWHG